MIDPVTLLVFIPAALALNLTPGADMLFCLGQGLRSGRATAVAASAGISAGSMVHVALAGLGLGAVVSALPGLFDVIRWIGVGYLVYLACSALRSGPVRADMPSVPARRAFRSGFLVNLANPKVILFVLAFVPQFVSPEAGPVLVQFLIFGLILAVGGFFINGMVGIFADQVRQRLTGSAVFARWLSRISAGIFAGLAVRLAVMERA
ncbi:threonine transporter RhtB [Rhodobacteraceae bacterium (ex Bugula neritina AB1)]|nr:threonine transporter RhtB [Rhodobacteraceae bacterium (ex Bugula neritina AB1)]